MPQYTFDHNMQLLVLHLLPFLKVHNPTARNTRGQLATRLLFLRGLQHLCNRRLHRVFNELRSPSYHQLTTRFRIVIAIGLEPF